MGVGAGLSMYVVVVQKFTFAISSPDEFLSYINVPQGSVATRVAYDGILNNEFLANLLLSLSVKELVKIVNI